MKTKLHLFQICLLGALLLLPAVARAQFTFTTNNGAITITGYTGSGAVVIPSTTNGYPVTSIGYNAFYDNHTITNVTIPDSVTSIGVGAFNECGGLISVMIGNSVTSIGDSAFINCASLTSITIPDGVTSIGGGSMFEGCISLTSVTIPNSVTNIGQFAFAGCYVLANIFIPSSVTSIGLEPFDYCPSLRYINVDASNPAYSSLNGVLFDKAQATLFEFPAALGANYTIPNSVTSIGRGAFDSCYSLTNLIIGSHVTSIGDDAFSYCDHLANVYFLGNAPTDGIGTFDGDPGTAYYLPGTTGWGAMFDSLPTAPWLLPNPLILNNGSGFGVQTNQFGFVISWATNISVAVDACTNLANPVWQPVQTNTLTGGTSYFSDPQWTNYPVRFYRLRSLPAVVLAQLTFTTNNGAITITGYTGSGAVVIPSTTNGYPVTSIADQAFAGNRSITDVTIPYSITSIGDDAFLGQATAFNVDVNNTNYSSLAGVLFDKQQATLIAYPVLSTNNNYTIPNSVTLIMDNAFYDCTSLTNVTIGNAVTSIEGGVFGSTRLTSITIPNSVTNIGGGVFAFCPNLTSATIGNSVTSIGNSAFLSCTSLTSISIPNSVTSIGFDVFAGCTSLTNATIGNGLNTIVDSTFNDCTSLTSVTIPNSVTSIGNYAFSSTSLAAVYFLGNAPTPTNDTSVFSGDNSGNYSPTAYYLQGTTGWGATFDGIPTQMEIP